jgi:hypothetical protein
MSRTLRKKIKLKMNDAVFIEWEDSYGCSDSWQDISSVGSPESMICRSMGWVGRKSERFIVIIPHVAKIQILGINQGCGDMTIPIASIIRVKRLPVSD